MGFSVGSVVNSAANIASRKSDKGKSSESSLYEFLGAMSDRGVQIKANFEAEFLQIGGFQFYCQSINFPGVKTVNASLFYKGREVQVPILAEQEHEFQMTILNDAQGTIYTTIRGMVFYDYAMSRRMLNNGYVLKIKALGDGVNTGGMNTIMRGVRLTGVSGLDYSHMDNGTQTFTVNGYADFVDFQTTHVKKKDGLLGKVDKISNTVSNVLGK
jgi:hypothetical protein